MTPEERQFLKDAFQAVAVAPLEAHDERFVLLYEARGEDVVALLTRGIEFSSGESVQFVCGLPGTGVTTELQSVFWTDAIDGIPALDGTYLDCQEEGEEEVFSKLETYDASHYIVVDNISRTGPFNSSLHDLKKEGMHIIYVLPWTFVFGPERDKNRQIIDKYGPLYWLPSLQLRDAHGELVQDGVEALEQLLANRFDTDRLFASDATLLKILQASGGNVRDCLRLAQEVLRRATSLPVEPQVVDAAIAAVQNARLAAMPAHALPLLARIAHSHELTIEDETIEDVERWAEAGLFLQYRNGREWYDVHPLVRDVVLEIADRFAGDAHPLTWPPPAKKNILRNV